MKSKSDITKRRGCIRVSKQLIDDLDINLFKLFFSNFYPINTDVVGYGDIMYYGYSEHFDISLEGESIQYEAVFEGININQVQIKDEPYPEELIEYKISFSRI